MADVVGLIRLVDGDFSLFRFGGRCPSDGTALTQAAHCQHSPLIETRFLHILLPSPFEGIMGAEPPFLYDRPSKYSFTAPTDHAFNPRAASQAALSPPKPRPTQNGPLINSINRHPDSYFAA